MFRKPIDDDCYGSRVVKAKPLPTKYAQKLLVSGKDFVSSGCEGGSNTSSKASCSSLSTVPLTEDERNKIHAKILKAEMKGDLEAVGKLRRKLEGKVEKNESVILLKRDRSGNVIPAQGSKGSSECFAKSSSRIHREYGKQQSLEEMMREEKSSTSGDQLMLFHRSIIKSAKVRRHDDDESLDDIAEMQKEKRGHEEKDRRRIMNQKRKDHQLLEHSLNDCIRCLASAKIAKHAIVAVGIHTYLAVVEWDGLDEQHCLIAPTEHACSSIQLDENVWDEMRVWRKGLVAMWRKSGQDCLFLEMSRNVAHGAHLVIECVPVPVEIGDTAPIYFKKAIMECEEDYADNKKLIEIKDLRRQIPRNFSYFAVDFGLNNGYAHVIENMQSFPSSFAHEIVAGMLDLPPSKWRKKKTPSYTEVKTKCDAMKAAWEPYDWTKRINRTNQ